MELMNSINLLILKAIGIGIVALLLSIIYKVFIKSKGDASTGSKKINATIKGSGLSKDKAAKGIIFGKKGKDKIFLESNQEGHIAIFGGSGKGKTTAILIPSLRAWDGGALTIDISGDISKNVKDERNMIFSPTEPESSCLYNIFYLIDKEPDSNEKRELLEQLANTIIDVPAKANDAQLYFAGTARKLFLASLIAFYNLGLDFVDICKTVFFASVMDLLEMIYITKNALAWSYVASMKYENEKNIAGSKSLLNDKIKIFADNVNMEKVLRRPCMIPEGKLEESFYPNVLEDRKVFIKIPDKKQEIYSSLLRVLVGQSLEYIGGRKFTPGKDKRILLGLDEFASLGHCDIIPGFRKFRKNGANICILTQSLADIDLMYHEKERQVMLDNCKYIVVLNAIDNGTREYFSNLVGKEDITSISKTETKNGGSTSTSTQKDYAIPPEAWKLLDKELVVIHPGGYIKLRKNYYWEGKIRDEQVC